MLLYQGYLPKVNRPPIPGDWIHFINAPGYAKRHPTGGFSEENGIYVGDNKMYGNPFGVQTFDFITGKMIEDFNSDDSAAKPDAPGPINHLPAGSGLAPDCRFFDVAKVAQYMFDHSGNP